MVWFARAISQAKQRAVRHHDESEFFPASLHVRGFDRVSEPPVEIFDAQPRRLDYT